MLFNRKTLSRNIQLAAIPADHLATLDECADTIRSGRVYTLMETTLQGELIV